MTNAAAPSHAASSRYAVRSFMTRAGSGGLGNLAGEIVRRHIGCMHETPPEEAKKDRDATSVYRLITRKRITMGR